MISLGAERMRVWIRNLNSQTITVQWWVLELYQYVGSRSHRPCPFLIDHSNAVISRCVQRAVSTNQLIRMHAEKLRNMNRLECNSEQIKSGWLLVCAGENSQTPLG